jgi:ectoine hydroxylase-related dioxygenase (phytanoyl-CoA dioxygenase family)
MSGLSEQQVAEYRTRGFVILRDVLDASTIQELQAATDSFLDRSRTMTASDAVIELDAGHTADEPRIRRIKSPHVHHPAYASSLKHPKLLDIVESLVGPDIRWHHTKLNAKAPGGGRQVEWHTDWGYYPHTNEDLLEIGIALDPITLDNGALRMLEGSHGGELPDHYENGKFVGAVPPGSFSMDDTVPIELELGDISIHHVRILHGSGPNLSARPRRLLLQGYAAADAWPLMAHHQPDDWPEWDARILRGSPTTQARLAASLAQIPLPLPKAMGLFDTQAQMQVSHYEREIAGASADR